LRVDPRKKPEPIPLVLLQVLAVVSSLAAFACRVLAGAGRTLK
jgi:hypothetical protein